MEAVHPNYVIVPGTGMGWDLKTHANTKLLIHSNTTDGSTTFVDSIGTHSPVVGAADVEHDTAQAKWGKSSILFDGDSGYITIPDHADWFMDTGPFTIDFPARIASVGADMGFFSQNDGSGNFATLLFNHSAPSKLRFIIQLNYGATVDFEGAWSPSVNTWYHLGLLRGWSGNANDWAITVDGAAVATTTDASAWHNIASPFYIGQYGLASFFNGWLDEFRVVKGAAVWTQTFIPPYGPYSL